MTDSPQEVIEAFEAVEEAQSAIGLLHSEVKGLDHIPLAAPGLRRLIEVIEVREDFRSVAERVLADVFLADSREQARAYFETPGANRRAVVVTEEGHVITDHSFYCASHDGGLVQLKAKAEELEEQIEDCKTSL